MEYYQYPPRANAPIRLRFTEPIHKSIQEDLNKLNAQLNYNDKSPSFKYKKTNIWKYIVFIIKQRKLLRWSKYKKIVLKEDIANFYKSPTIENKRQKIERTRKFYEELCSQMQPQNEQS